MSTLLAAARQPESSTLALALVVGVCSLLVGAAVAFLLSRRHTRADVRARVGAFLSPPATGEQSETAERLGRIFSRTERSLEGERWWSELNVKLEIARIQRPAIEIVYLTATGSLAAGALLALAAGSPFAGVVALVIGPLVARWIIEFRLRRVRIQFAEQLPSHLQELAAAMRAGHSMVSGITVMADAASEPTRSEFQRVIADEQLGMPLSQAMGQVAVRMEAKDMEQVALVAELHSQTGGNMAEVLDRVAEAVRERAELNRELRTLTAQARMSRWIVTALPPVLLGLIYLINPSYLAPLFETSTGQFLLVAAVGMVVGGSLVMGRIVRIEA